ncbi:CYTH and CHAD domain-containing protein [Aliiglaciecola sp. LCG003]|uniref:CYTH domain-containing protein n=1 Tax=Aliiglaciecola sp. LCG003 TaxID=3053655 RepID=UPI0025726460|nr:CYTH and CHAD domain-containing protein [Aliiglaciecola sp. LCG003]WJG09034.1 CYTH domain-containing protein [Aliiglaciecola sp. LCG003]
MEQEIELKLLLPQGLDETALLSAMSSFSANIETAQFSLFNQYFDTADWILSAHSIGLRVRSSEQGIEQTIKTAGKSVGGLHQRPEYNVAINSLHPNLSLFSDKIWPQNLSVSYLQEHIEPIFSTDFKRKAFVLRLSDGSDVELVYDSGTISTGKDHTQISEIELELKQGSVETLFQLAEKIAAIGPTQLCNISKAGRGFLLVKHALAPAKKELRFVELNSRDSVEQAFIKGLEYTLTYWQQAEYRYMQTKKINDLVDVYIGLRVTSECIATYRNILPCNALTDLHNALAIRLRKWSWIEQLKSLKILRSKRGAYSKRLSQHDALVSYIRGLQDGTINLSRPDFLITHKDNTLLQLRLSSLLIEKPWRNNVANDNINRNKFFSANLDVKWQGVFAQITPELDTSEGYLQQQDALRSALFTDLLLGASFSSARRDAFRLPWLDMLDGMDELQTLKVLRTKLQDSDVDDKADLIAWCEVKKKRLLTVIEQTKSVALSMETYW